MALPCIAWHPKELRNRHIRKPIRWGGGPSVTGLVCCAGRQAVERVVDRHVSKLERALSAALDPRKLGPAAAGAGGLLAGPGAARSATSAPPGSSAKLNEV